MPQVVESNMRPYIQYAVHMARLSESTLAYRRRYLQWQRLRWHNHSIAAAAVAIAVAPNIGRAGKLLCLLSAFLSSSSAGAPQAAARLRSCGALLLTSVESFNCPAPC